MLANLAGATRLILTARLSLCTYKHYGLYGVDVYKNEFIVCESEIQIL